MICFRVTTSENFKNEVLKKNRLQGTFKKAETKKNI